MLGTKRKRDTRLIYFDLERLNPPSYYLARGRYGNCKAVLILGVPGHEEDVLKDIVFFLKADFQMYTKYNMLV